MRSPQSATPEVLILSRPHFEESHRIFLESRDLTWTVNPHSTDAEKLIEFAGRLCYMSFGRDQHTSDTSQYIGNLIRNGHESVLEHAVWSFLLTGVSRAFSHQFVRHRVGFSFSQLSQQYHDEAGFQIVMPAGVDRVPGARLIVESLTEAARKAYSDLSGAARAAERSAGSAKREQIRAFRSLARSVLPNATETKLVVTTNARALRHFLKLRGTIEGDLEMRAVAAELLNKIAPDAPSVFSDFQIEKLLSDGLPIVRVIPLESGD